MIKSNLFINHCLLLVALATPCLAKEPSEVIARDSSEFFRTLGLAISGLDDVTFAYVTRFGARSLRMEMPQDGQLKNYADWINLGGRGTLIAPNLPVIDGGAAETQMLDQWQIDIRNNLTRVIPQLSTSTPVRVFETIEGLEGLNEREYVDCRGYPGYDPPCKGWQRNFINSTIRLDLQQKAEFPGVNVLGGAFFKSSAPGDVLRALASGQHAYPDLALKNLTQQMKTGNIHIYNDAYKITAMKSAYSKLATTSGTWITEWGYYRSNPPVGMDYFKRAMDALLQSYSSGIQRIFLYTLRSSDPKVTRFVAQNPDGDEVSPLLDVFGVINKNLYYPGPRTAGVARSLRFTLQSKNAKSVVYQRSPDTKIFYALIWGQSDSNSPGEIQLGNNVGRVEFWNTFTPQVGPQDLSLSPLNGGGKKALLPGDARGFPVLVRVTVE